MCLPITFLLLSSFLPASHADERRAALLAGPCVVCHGGSNADTQIPPLQGKSASDIEKAMQDFRAGRRPSTIMARHARGYTEEEIRLIAGYLASQSDPVDR
ncbi:MAG: hypothetical protein A2V90_08100 [Gammaproteobacteria bacterium RBG_16_57_12]|nr:MAG: hypothetical protein A2V90_08100 [Gammaproteobacteria bacterium RBG_16_57_12]